MTPTADDYLFEIGFEEFPAKLLLSASQHLQSCLDALLKKEALTFEVIEAFATPRRLAILIHKLAFEQPTKQVEKRGPAIQAAYDSQKNPLPALIGFAKSLGVSIDELRPIKTDKGERLCYQTTQKGLSAKSILPKLIEQALNSIPAPKKMKWGSSKFSFIRPVKWVLSLHGTEALPLSLFGLESLRETKGHRAHHPEPLTIDHAKNYEQLLEEKGFVIPSFSKRKNKISLMATQKLEIENEKLNISDALLEEITGLVEYPQALRCSFPETFLTVPQEALVSTMETNQKYFPVYDLKNTLKASFIIIANIASSNPATVIQGNEKVVRPRLADAKFFFEKDKAKTPQELNDKLKNILFQLKLGSVWDKTERVGNLAKHIAQKLKHSETTVKAILKANQLSKTDLASEMVGEFPELQGIIGGYLAQHWGEKEEIVIAIKEHYAPRFAQDNLPITELGTILSLADKLDTLAGIFGAGIAPTGDKDPFGLRRAMLGVLRILLEKAYPLDLSMLLTEAQAAFNKPAYAHITISSSALLDFAVARLPAAIAQHHIRGDVLNSVIVTTKSLVLEDILDRAKAVQAFLSTTESESFVAAFKRIKNILAKAENTESLSINASLFEKETEKNLHEKLQALEIKAETAHKVKDYSSLLNIISHLKPAVDVFFDSVMVNTEQLELKNNRLALLAQTKKLFGLIADFSLIQT